MPMYPRSPFIVVVGARPLANQVLDQLAPAGFTALVTDAADALAWAEERMADLLIADSRMAGSASMELIRRIRARLPELPVIVLTKARQHYDIAHALPSVTRPEPGALARRCCELLNQAVRREHDDAPEQADHANEPRPATLH